METGVTKEKHLAGGLGAPELCQCFTRFPLSSLPAPSLPTPPTPPCPHPTLHTVIKMHQNAMRLARGRGRVRSSPINNAPNCSPFCPGRTKPRRGPSDTHSLPPVAPRRPGKGDTGDSEALAEPPHKGPREGARPGRFMTPQGRLPPADRRRDTICWK